MSDVFNVLSQDHAEVKRMLDELHAGSAATTGGTAEQLEGRKKLADQLIAAESSHEAAEERFFWPAVRQLGPAASGLAEEAIRQERAAKQSLAALGKLEVAAAFESVLTEVISSAHEHIAFEEEQVWPLLRQAISAEEALELGSKIRKARETGPIRPHPSIPAAPGDLKAAGSAAAALDKLRDAATAWGDS